MKVYTYCNYKGSLKGYQFAKFDLNDSKDEVSSFDLNQTSAMVPPVVTEWFWDRSGWKIVLIADSGRGTENFLLIRGIEKAREFQRERASGRQAEIEAGNQYRKKPKSDETPVPDSEFYINLGFQGKMNELRQLAVSLINELRQDGGVRLLNILEPVLSKVGLTYYSINLPKLRVVLSEIQCKKIAPAIPQAAAPKLRIPFLRKKRPRPYIRLDSPRGIRREDRQRQINALIHTLMDTQTFSECLPFYVSNGITEPEGMTPNLAVDLDYLFSVAKG